jgi:uroporphyrinogen decarboxylase
MAKRLLRTLGGEAVWPPPIWLMRQAGRYLPEYQDVRARVADFISLCTTPELAAEVTVQPIRRYEFDAAILFSDILILPWALGQEVAFKAGEGPILPPLRDARGLAGLQLADVAERTAPVMETVRRVRAMLSKEGFDQTALIGFAGAPFTVACYMVGGGGSRDFAATREMVFAEPQLFDQLIDLLVEATVTYLLAQVDAGAEALMLFDSWAGILSPTSFRRYVIAPAQRIAQAIRLRYPEIKLIGFPRLAGSMVADYAAATGVAAVGLDTSVDLTRIAPMLPEGVAIQGNLDPLALVAGGEALETEAGAVLAAVRVSGRPFIFNLGHGILPHTPPEHVRILRDLVRAG